MKTHGWRGLAGSFLAGSIALSSACTTSEESCAMACSGSVRFEIVLDVSSETVLAGDTLLCIDDHCAVVNWDPDGHGESALGSVEIASLAPTHSGLSVSFTVPQHWDLGSSFGVTVLDSNGVDLSKVTRTLSGPSKDCAGCRHGEARIEPGAAVEATCKSGSCASGVVLDRVIAAPLERMSGAELEICHNLACSRGRVGTWSAQSSTGGGSRPLEGDVPGTLEVYADGDRFDVFAHLPVAGALLTADDVGRFTIIAKDGSVVASGQRIGFEQSQPNGEACSGPIGCRRIVLTPD